MKKKAKFFFFGFGQSAKYFIKDLIQSQKKFTFCATNTKKSSYHYFAKKRFKSFKFKDNNFDKKLIKVLESSEYILVSIPPKKKKDLVLKNFSKTLQNSKFKKLIYLSATSVYGNHNGKWVNEKSKLKGKTIFGIRRKVAEKLWINFRNKSNKDINILRVSGIYSKENNVLKKISKKNIFVKEKKIFFKNKNRRSSNHDKKNFLFFKKIHDIKCIRR